MMKTYLLEMNEEETPTNRVERGGNDEPRASLYNKDLLFLHVTERKSGCGLIILTTPV